MNGDDQEHVHIHHHYDENVNRLVDMLTYFLSKVIRIQVSHAPGPAVSVELEPQQAKDEQ